MATSTVIELEYQFLASQLGALALPNDTINDLRSKFYTGLNAGTISLAKNSKPRFPNRYYTSDAALAGDTTIVPVLGSMFLQTFEVGQTTTFDRIGCETTVGVAGATIECLVYSYDGKNTFTKILQSSVAADTAAFPTNAISLTLQPGMYWIGTAVFSPTTAPTVRARGVSSNIGMTVGNDNTSGVGMNGIANAAAVPNSFALITNQTNTTPKVMIHTAP